VSLSVLAVSAAPSWAFFGKSTAKPAEPVYEQSLQEQYQSCTSLARQQPAETFKRAQKWFQESKTMAAHHCMALALFEMRDFANAAKELEDLLTRLDPQQQPDLWLSMKEQAAKAHAYNKREDLAEKHLTEAL